MAERKTPEQKLQELEKQMEQLKAKKKAINAQISKAERAQRTRRLIQIGALSEKYFDCEKIDPADFEKLISEIVGVEQVKAILKEKANV